MKKGQSTTDYLILTVVILMVIVPLLYFSSGRIDQNRFSQLQDALDAIQQGVIQVSNLGYGTSTVVVVQVPKGVVEQKVGGLFGETSWCMLGMLCYKIGASDFVVRTPVDVQGILPTNEGTHYVRIFNNGKNVLLYECGNNIREALEQCDGADSSSCLRDGKSEAGLCSGNSEKYPCTCHCLDNNDCAKTTGLCSKEGICVACSKDKDCSDGKTCLAGTCVNSVPCTTNNDCKNPSYPAVVCNKEEGKCEPCGVKPFTPYPDSGANKGSLKDCNPGDICFGVAPSPSSCGPNINANKPPSVNAGPDQKVPLPNLQAQLTATATDDGKLQPLTFMWDFTTLVGSGKISFTPDNSLKSLASFPKQPGQYLLRISAYDGQYTSSDDLKLSVVCSVNKDCFYPNEVCASEVCRPCKTTPECTSPDQCVAGVCTSITQSCIGSLCSGGYVCKDNICTACSNTVPCPNGYTCNNVGTCQLTGPTTCGDGIVKGAETCEFNPLTGAPLAPLCGSNTRCSTKTCQCEAASAQSCGDGTVTSPLEECDVGRGNFGKAQGTCGAGNVCTASCVCQAAADYCGDGKISSVAGREQCDPAISWGAPGSGGCGFGKYCTTSCTCRLRYGGYCGDGSFDALHEECESGAMTCPWGPKGPLTCIGCHCYDKNDVRPKGPPGDTPPRGNPVQKCQIGTFYLGAGSCNGDCPNPKDYCQPVSSVCSCSPEQNTLCQIQGQDSCLQPSDCGEPGKYDCRNYCCYPLTPNTCKNAGQASCSQPSDCGNPNNYDCRNNCCYPITPSGCKNSGQTSCSQASDCGDPGRYDCRENCCYPITPGGCGPNQNSCVFSTDCRTGEECINNCCVF